MCPVGFWCAGGANDKTACAGGTYAATDGSVSDAACSDCNTGTFSPEGSSGCTKCDPGTVAPALGAATCDSCEPGKYAVSTGSAFCTSCPVGKTSVSGSVSETDCSLDSNGTITISLTETVTMVVSLPMTKAEFDGEKQQAFKEALAKTAGQGVRADQVFIDSIEEISTAARRLLAQGIRVTVSVKATDQDAAAAIASRLTEEDINTELEEAGLPPATVLEAAAVQEGGKEKAATLSMGPWAVVGLTVGVTSVFTFGVWKMLQVLPEHPFTDENAQFALLQDFCDCALDWVSWGGTASAGDFDFSNDKDRVISGFVLVLSALGFVFFLVDLCSYLCNGKRLRKDILILKLESKTFHRR